MIRARSSSRSGFRLSDRSCRTRDLQPLPIHQGPRERYLGIDHPLLKLTPREYSMVADKGVDQKIAKQQDTECRTEDLAGATAGFTDQRHGAIESQCDSLRQLKCYRRKLNAPLAASKKRLATLVDRGITEVLFDSQQLVVFGQPIRPRQRACLDLSTIGRYG